MLLIYIEKENVLGWMNLLATGEKPSKLWKLPASKSTVEKEKIKGS